MYFYKPNEQINIDGNVPTLPNSIIQYSGNQDRLIGKVFDRFAMYCIKGLKLEKEVELKSFEPSTTKISRYIVSQAWRMVDKNQLHTFDFLNDRSFDFDQTIPQIQQCFNELKNINNNFSSVSKSQRHAYIQRQKEINENKNQLFQALERRKQCYVAIDNEIAKIKSHSDLINFERALKVFINIKRTNQNLKDYNPIKWGQSITLSISQTSNAEQIGNNFSSLFDIDLKFESIPVYLITIKHLKKTNISQEGFVSLIQNIASNFGCLIQKIFDYKIIEDSPSIQGLITLTMLTSEFTIPLAGMIKEAIENAEGFGMPIKGTIIDPSIQRHQLFRKEFNKWIKEQNPNVKFDGLKLRGSEAECNNILRNIRSFRNPLKLINIPPDLPLDIISKKILLYNRRNGTKWVFKRVSQEIIVPADVENNLILTFFDLCRPRGSKSAEQDLFGDVLCCGEEAISSKIPINVYYKNRPPVSKGFCVPCTFETIKHLVPTMYDDESGTPIFERIMENQDLLQVITLSDDEIIQNSNEDWPRVPLGQKIWALINDNTTAEVTKIWLTAAKVYGFRHSNLITFCPYHPSVLLLAPPLHTPMKCIFKECNCSICPECSMWHKPGMCNARPKLPPGFRICPSCKRMVEKTQACNHISCSCGKHFCYYCGAGPWDNSSPCYTHLMEHGGCFNDPPDYRKYYLHENVSDNELNNFYRQYPQYKP